MGKKIKMIVQYGLLLIFVIIGLAIPIQEFHERNRAMPVLLFAVSLLMIVGGLAMKMVSFAIARRVLRITKMCSRLKPNSFILRNAFFIKVVANYFLGLGFGIELKSLMVNQIIVSDGFDFMAFALGLLAGIRLTEQLSRSAFWTKFYLKRQPHERVGS